ncbi:MAG: hypothetical protein ACJ8F7_09065 [Gemmataceae bacterium]
MSDRQIEFGAFCKLTAVISCLSLAPVTLAQAPPAESKTAKIQRLGYNPTSIQGFTVAIHQQYQLLLGKRQYGNLTEAISADLEDAAKAIPKEKRKTIQDVTIWIEWDDSKFPQINFANQYIQPLGMYIPRGKRYPVDDLFADKRGGIMVSGKECFTRHGVEMLQEYSAYWMLHELSHAFQDLTIGLENEKVEAAYKQAVDGGLYRSVEGKMLDSATGKIKAGKVDAYALYSHKEYFAELSVAYLAKNNTYPHTHLDLKKYDPRGYELMRKSWGEKPVPVPILLPTFPLIF